MALRASCVLRSFSCMKAVLTAMALSKAACAVVSCPWVRARAPLVCCSCVAKFAAMSSRLAWMADLTLAVRLATSSLYLASSRSSSVALALTMAMLSFMRGTWSFMSRMFCWRISSGSSATEMKKPMNERTILVNRCHINAPYTLRLLAGLRCRRCTVATGGDRIFGNKRRNCVGDLLFFLLLFQPPAEKAFFLAGDFLVLGLNLGPLLGDILIDVRLDLAVLLGLGGFQRGRGPFLHALVPVQGAVAADSILDHVFDVHASRVQGHQDRRASHIGGPSGGGVCLQPVP